MIELYHRVSLNASKNVTQLYSTSFSMGIKLLDKNIHDAIFSIYGFVRLADEIVDTFHDYPKSEMLQEFKDETYKALDRKISVNPILHAFQMVVNKYSIARDLIDKFLLSMEQDLNDIQYSSVGYKEYIVGSAEVVGLMCLKVFVNGDNDLYFKLEEPARRLGAAFQKINFLRDVKSDYQELGRTYFPGVDLEKFTPNEWRFDIANSSIVLADTVGEPGSTVEIFAITDGDYRINGKIVSLDTTPTAGQKVEIFQFSNHDLLGIERINYDVRNF